MSERKTCGDCEYLGNVRPDSTFECNLLTEHFGDEFGFRGIALVLSKKMAACNDFSKRDDE